MSAFRYLMLPNGKLVRAADYAQAWRRLRAMDPKAMVAGFGHFPEEAGTILRFMREGLHNRINPHLPWWGTGRKWEALWQIDIQRAARELNHPRLIIDWLPPDLKPRFAHRLRGEG